MRRINGHAVYGKEVMVNASSEQEAKIVAVKGQGDYWAWEAKEVSPGQWACYIAKHDSVFALND